MVNSFNCGNKPYIELLAFNSNFRFQCHRDQSSVNAIEPDLKHGKSICGTSKTSSRPQVTAPENIENRIGVRSDKKIRLR